MNDTVRMIKEDGHEYLILKRNVQKLLDRGWVLAKDIEPEIEEDVVDHNDHNLTQEN